jgi:hypothetical protein
LLLKEFELRLAKQVLYHLSHTSCPFCSGYFGDGGLENYLPGLALNHDPPNLNLSSSQDYRHESLVSGLFLSIQTQGKWPLLTNLNVPSLNRIKPL